MLAAQPDWPLLPVACESLVHLNSAVSATVGGPPAEHNPNAVVWQASMTLQQHLVPEPQLQCRGILAIVTT